MSFSNSTTHQSFWFHLLQYQPKKEILLLTLLFLTVYTLSFCTTYSLYELGLYQRSNIVFDLDQGWFIDIISRFPDKWLYPAGSEETPLLVKHPLIYLLGVPAEILQFFGLTEELSAILVILFFISASPILFYYCLRLCNHTYLNSVILAIAFVCTATFLVNMMVLDSYSVAQFWILAAMILFLKSMSEESPKYTWSKAGVYVGLVGTTSYLILFAILCELTLLCLRLNKVPIKYLVNYLLTLFIKFSILFIFLFLLVYSDILLALISDPIVVLKMTLWAVTLPGEKEGLGKIIETFLLYSVLSPAVSAVDIGSNITMMDYRSLNFSFVGYIAIPVLGIFYVLSFSRISSPILRLAILWIIINLFFHLIYQYRSSLFLYTGHVLPVIFLCICQGIERLRKYATVVGLLLLALLIAENSDVYMDVRQSLKINGVVKIQHL